jgi:hypothetical protein
MGNNYVTASTHNFFVQPFIDAKKNWKVACNSNYPLCGRVKHLAVALFLAIPLINYISYLILRSLCTYAPKDLSTHKPAKIKFGQDQVIKFDKFNQLNSTTSENVVRHTDKSKIPERRRPPVAMQDTVRADDFQKMMKEGIKSIHQRICFDDEEILQVHDTKREKIHCRDGQAFDIERTKNNKVVILQQTNSGCTAAVAAMRVADHGKKIDLEGLRSSYRQNTEAVLQYIRDGGLNPLQTNVDSLSQLREAIRKNGPAIVDGIGTSAVGLGVEAHTLIVDEVSEDLQSVRLRDSYHGWEITITAKAFEKFMMYGEVIQVPS